VTGKILAGAKQFANEKGKFYSLLAKEWYSTVGTCKSLPFSIRPLQKLSDVYKQFL